jgi:hypothetical protein
MKEILSTVLLTALVVFTAVAPLGMAQSTKQEATKDNQEQKRSSFGFEDDQSAICMSATRQAKMIASIVDSYSRRLAACALSNPSFRDDCSADFGRLARGYNEYQVAVSSVRNYCK